MKSPPVKCRSVVGDWVCEQNYVFAAETNGHIWMLREGSWAVSVRKGYAALGGEVRASLIKPRPTVVRDCARS